MPEPAARQLRASPETSADSTGYSVLSDVPRPRLQQQGSASPEMPNICEAASSVAYAWYLKFISHLALRSDSTLTCTETSSGVHREFWMEVTASSAVNLPITSASLRLGVVWMGDTLIRCTYCGTSTPLRFTFTTNFVFFMVGYYFYSTPTEGLYSLPRRFVKNRDAAAAKACGSWTNALCTGQPNNL
jgi:hypothetical protein